MADTDFDALERFLQGLSSGAADNPAEVELPLPDHPTYRARHYLICPVPNGTEAALGYELTRHLGAVGFVHIAGGCARVVFEKPQGNRALQFFRSAAIDGVRLFAWPLPLFPVQAFPKHGDRSSSPEAANFISRLVQLTKPPREGAGTVDYSFRDIPLKCPSTPNVPLKQFPSHPDPLSTRFSLGPGTPLQHTRNVRRFLFYPVPDGIMVADLRASLAFRLGPVERICVIDWLADVHFSAQLEHEALRYSVPIGPTGALCQSNALVL
ncbi:uncharacterized protein CcaverHIS019_0510970 [Cutaneotrichosporon cavernicola]|uniref:Uncharacterized protein n=1 Tax=Cutaneotrichosporon cavernicola TaxID=279322 RepID=A0AA48L7K8_9TREE|nr:uncharacterized protein CcaverHIS019_0510970 [Cutaneotrichosporon cavernicola]BEI93469.1 hypothetical protein CcaverHIS019_0510970 [Cutaneotrichosporon cavernicola]BEJ01248.1 hypothetical protein CcaverHIS631_0511050 [Cutaneotrichosporon cavernicola]